MQEDAPWILFDSGAAAHCCPLDFASDWPLLPLTGRAPSLRAISGQALTVYGRRLVKVEFNGQPCFLHFCVCDVPYCVVSVGRLLRQGYQVNLSMDEHTLSTPDGRKVPVVRHGSLLFLCPSLTAFDPLEFESICNSFHEANSKGLLVAPTFQTPYHHDRWELSGNALKRIHKRSRATFFSPDGTKDRPVELDDLANDRVTFLQYEDGTTQTLTDNWRTVENPKGNAPKRFVGYTLFKLKSPVPANRVSTGKQSTFPASKPQALQQTSEPQPSPKTLPPRSVEDRFALRLSQASAGTLEAFKVTLLEQLNEQDPATGQPYTHDVWLNFPTVWALMHYELRSNLFVPNDPDFEQQLGDGRMTLIVRPDMDQEVLWHCDNWRQIGIGEGLEAFIGATCFEKAELEVAQAEPEGDDFVAQRPKGLKQPGEPTLTERLEHELTHLPFRPWCEVCLKAKSKQAKSKKLSLRQPVLQMDF